MKKIIAILLVVVLSVALGSCAANDGSSAGPDEAVVDAQTESDSQEGTEEVNNRIGMLVPTLQAEFFVNYSEGVKEILEENGYEMTVAGFEMDSNKAIEIIENYVVSNVACIIALVSDKSCDTALKAAMDAGIKVVVPGVETGYYDLCCLADNKDVGVKIAEMAADFINTKLDGKAEVVAFVSTANTDMADRSNSMVDTLRELVPGATIETTESKEVGEYAAAMENFLQMNPDIKVVVSYGDQGGLEALEVVKAAGKAGDDFAIFGCDCTEQALKAIAAGECFRGTVAMGDVVKDTALPTLQLLSGEQIEKRQISTNIKVTAENVDEYISE